MKSAVAIFLIMGCGSVQADVYKWTDEHGEVHFGEIAPSANSEKVMTQEQIQQIERADQAKPKAPAETDLNIDQEAQFKISECKRFKGLRDAYLLNTDNVGRYRINMILGQGYYPMNYGLGDNSNLTDYNQIEAGIRNYCQD